MTYRLHLARRPSALDAPRSLVIEDFLRFVSQGKKACLRAAIEMCTDLHQNGIESRYVKPLGGPLYELKKRASDGGARVYFFRHEGGFVLVHAECKNENQADQNMLLDALDIIEALEDEVPVLS